MSLEGTSRASSARSASAPPRSLGLVAVDALVAIVIGATAGRCSKAGSAPRSRPGHPEQRHAELHQHGGRGARGARDRRAAREQTDGATPAELSSEFSRPFTLVAPALGFASGAATAYGAAPRETWHSGSHLYPLIGLTMAAVLNAASNALNQIYDLEIDRVNKPKRPLPSGRLSMRDAGRSPGHLRVALVLAWLVAPGGSSRVVSGSLLIATVITSLYSVPAGAHKRLGSGPTSPSRSARRPAQGRRLVGGEDGHGLEPWYIGANLRALPGGRRDDQGLLGHGRGRARRVPHAADHLWRQAGCLDDLSVVRRPILDDCIGAWDGIPDRQFPAAHRAGGTHGQPTASMSVT
jgi:hypothetical protein